MRISTHVLDATSGRPAAGVAVRLDHLLGDGWTTLIEHETDDDGRIADLAGDVPAGDYRLVFDTGAYFEGNTFYPEVAVTFRALEPATHHHVPLLLSPWAYTTYRGS